MVSATIEIAGARRLDQRAIASLASLTRRFHPRGAERILRAIYSPERRERDRFQAVVRMRDGAAIICDTGSYIEWRVFFFGAYEPEIARLVRQLCGDSGTAIDVGANIGCHTLAMAAAVGRGGRVVAFEPSGQSFERLMANVALNGFGQVEAVNAALGEREETLELVSPPSGHAQHGMATFHAENLAEATRDIVRTGVRVRTLDAFAVEAGLRRLDVMKIDVEGHEMRVLEGGRATIARFRPSIVFEFAARWAEHAGFAWGDVADYFGGLGYEISAVGRDGRLRRFEGVPSDGNFLARPR